MAQKLDMQTLLERVRGMRVWRQRDVNAPHKPLLMLYALANLQRRGPRYLRFADAEAPLRQLLAVHGPSKGRQSPDYPFWHLRSDGLWEIPGAEEKPTGTNKPALTAMRALEGGFPDDVQAFLSAHPWAIQELARAILAQHFPESLHQDILDEVGLAASPGPVHAAVAEERSPYAGGTDSRDPEFRGQVLRAYEYRCAFCGFQCLLDGRAVLVEAAHVRWHAKGGPDDVRNALALCNLHHKALDLGILSVSTEGAILVSSMASGGVQPSDPILSLAGRRFTAPRSPSAQLLPSHVRWHADNVFHGPALAV